jgi:uracil-DNA glycosylase
VIKTYGAAVAAMIGGDEEGWSGLAFFKDGSAAALAQQLDQLVAEGRHVLPAPNDLFTALRLCPLDRVTTVILGQDPYPTPGDAHGLAFSVNKERPIPRSLVNIFKELESDLALPRPSSGHLGHWAQQGVLLLNTCLTVEAGKAGCHRGMGWTVLTEQMIRAVSASAVGRVFLLWGADAQGKRALVAPHHHVIATAHPSPLSAYRGFLGSRPFSRTNEWLIGQGQAPVDWSLD